MRDEFNQAESFVWENKGRIWKWVLFFFVLATVIGIFSWVGGWFTIAGKYTSAEFVTQTYTWFREQEQAIIQTETMIKSAQKDINDFKTLYGADTIKWNWADREEYSRLTAVKQGYTRRYNQLVAEWNAKRTSVLTSWIDAKLPVKELPIEKAQWIE